MKKLIRRIQEKDKKLSKIKDYINNNIIINQTQKEEINLLIKEYYHSEINQNNNENNFNLDLNEYKSQKKLIEIIKEEIEKF